MRTSPLPNRHAHDLSLFAETIQATLNRNRSKGDLSRMTSWQIRKKLWEEVRELDDELRPCPPAWQADTGETVDPGQIEREAADLAVCALAAFIKARGLANG